MTNTARQCRNGDRCIPQTFAEAVDCVAHHSVDEQGKPLTIPRIASRIGRDENYLRKACSQYDDTHPLRGDLIVALTTATHNYAIVDYIARQTGCAVFHLPSVSDDHHADIMGHAATAVGDFGDVLKHVQEAIADGHVTPEEAERLVIEASELIATLVKLKHTFRQKAKVS